MTTQARQTEPAGPERPGGQGLDRNQEESGNLAIHYLLASDDGKAWTDFVATCRETADGHSYEAWALRGLVRWTRSFGQSGGYRFDVVEVIGENPLERQDPWALSTYEDEMAAAGSPADVQEAFIEPDALTYPYAYERISQLFDSPNAPDLVVNPKSYAYGRQPGQHGALDVVQSRSPLVFSGPGMKQGERVEAQARQVDVAPTIARAMGFPLIEGRDSSGRSSGERGTGADVYFRRQDGAVIDEVFDGSEERPERTFLLLLDGQSHTELFWRLDNEPTAIPNLRRIISSGAALRHGSITNFPSITWPSHNAIGTSCWSGHHDIVNPSYYLRERRETVSPQGQQFETAKFLSHEVETLYEAFHRVYGSWNGMDGAFTASVNEPCTRGADHASLERQLIGDRERLRELTRETEHEISARWSDELAETGHHLIGLVDNRALGQARHLMLDETHPFPKFMYFEFSLPDGAAHDYGPHHPGAREALDETDVRIGRLLEVLDAKGLFDSTLFVVTTDHGMATQDTTLLANPARIPERMGMAAVTCEPFVYLRDLDIAVQVSHDGRTAQVSVLDNDADESGERPAVAGARILVSDHRDGRVATATTDASGYAGFAVPMEQRPHDLVMSIQADGFNTRHMRLDGANLGIDLREALYGGRFA